MEQLLPLITQSLQLLLLGMGTVFVILILLIFVITMTSKYLSKFADEPEHTTISAMTNPLQNDAGAPDQSQLVAVVSAAISAYKRNHPET
jgi:oxaloacetate decarboxylase gamma subunit